MIPEVEQIDRLVSIDEFFAFITKPENQSHDYELVNGRITEVVTDGYASQVALEVAFYIRLVMRQNNIQGRLTGEAGGYWVSGKPYIPDVAFMSTARQVEPEYDRGYNILAPDLAVEVLSPGNTDTEMSTKVADYLAAGTTVWIFKPKDKTVSILAPGKPSITLSTDDTLDAGALLPGFNIPIRDLFPSQTLSTPPLETEPDDSKQPKDK